MKKEGDMWICEACYERIHCYPDLKMTSIGHLEPIDALNHENIHHVPAEIPRVHRADVKTPFLCAHCGYKFDRDSFDLDRACPYCGEKGTVHLAKFVIS